MNNTSMHLFLDDNNTLPDETDIGAVLNDKNYENLLRCLPVIILMATFGVVGFVGNLLASVFYYKMLNRSSTIYLIICLCVTDLLVCVTIWPTIAEMVSTVTFSNRGACKVIHFASHWFIAVSCLFVWLISIDRHRRICYPFGCQVSLRVTRRAALGIVIFGMFEAGRNLINYDTVTVTLNIDSGLTINGSYCTVREDGDYEYIGLVFIIGDFVIIMSVWITMIVTYTHIIYNVFKLRKTWLNASVGLSASSLAKSDTEVNLQNALLKNPRLELQQKSLSDGTLYKAQTNHLLQYSAKNGQASEESTPTSLKNGRSADALVNQPADETQSVSLTLSKAKLNLSQTPMGGSTENPTFSKRERKLTFMMLTVSIVFIACFVPFFVIRLVIRGAFHSGEEYELNAGIQFALNLVYLNSAFNPIIYFIFNKDFRKFIRSLLYKCNRAVSV